MKKVIVAHPSKQHSLHTATALKKNGLLFKYITTVYDKKGSITSRIKSLLGEKDRVKAETHKSMQLEDEDVIQFYELDYLISLLLNRITALAKIREFHRRYVANKFGQKVAEYAVSNKVDAVIMYDSTATRCFETLRNLQPEITRILDVSIAARPFLREKFDNDINATGDYSLRKDFSYLWNNSSIKTFWEEIHLADYFLAPSQIVKESLCWCGADQDRVFIIPYGVDLEKFPQKEEYVSEGVLRVIYVGQVTHRKGIHHLLNVLDRFSETEISLNLVGGYSTKENFYKEYSHKKNVTFHGFKNHDELLNLYHNSDVFVFPTLGEGYGLVVLEAMSCGLPVICSNHAGGNDAIVDGYNGFVFDAGDDSELYNKISWCIKNRTELVKMGKNASKSAKKFTWDNYYKNITKALEEFEGD